MEPFKKKRLPGLPPYINYQPLSERHSVKVTDEEPWRQRTSQTLGSGGGGNEWVLGWATYSQEVQSFIDLEEYTAEPTITSP